jgi:2,3-bisphosphoglycerate-independent phosphoglycerate mutase
MKYAVVIMDGAAGRSLPDHGNKTCLELAHTPNLDRLAGEGTVGLVRTVPPGMEPSSAIACMSLLGYDPLAYYRGRASIEALSMGIPVGPGEVVFRCNLVAVRDGKMLDYSAGHIPSEEAALIVATLNDKLGGDRVHFYPGVSYRHILKLGGMAETLNATCTPPHDIPGQPIAGFLPQDPGSDVLLDLMRRSEAVLRDHPVNVRRRARGEVAPTTIWLFWGSGAVPQVPSFQDLYGLRAAMTSGVDLLRGLAKMMSMTILEIPGVTDGLDNDCAAQVKGALAAMEGHDLAVIHVEAPDEAGHAGSVEEKVRAIEKIDAEVIAPLRARRDLRLLVMPDHPTPIESRTHDPEPVPFLLSGQGFAANGAGRLTESDARRAALLIEPGCIIMKRLTGQA